jgi:hypothetical protein
VQVTKFLRYSLLQGEIDDELSLACGCCTVSAFSRRLHRDKKEWRKDGVPKDVVKRQKALCEYKAELDAGSPAGLSGDAKESRKSQVGKFTALCMSANGYKEEVITEYK